MNPDIEAAAVAAPVTPETVTSSTIAAPATVLVSSAETTKTPKPTEAQRTKRRQASALNKAAKKITKTSAPRIHQMDDAQFKQEVLDTLYSLRRNTTKWADLRNSTKEGERLDTLLRRQPNYKWQTLGHAHYLMPLHEDTKTPVAYILLYDPRDEYNQQKAAYATLLKNPRKKKSAVEPKKPASMRRDFLWRISNKRGTDEKEGHCLKLEDAKLEVLKRKAQFLV